MWLVDINVYHAPIAKPDAGTGGGSSGADTEPGEEDPHAWMHGITHPLLFTWEELEEVYAKHSRQQEGTAVSSSGGNPPCAGSEALPVLPLYRVVRSRQHTMAHPAASSRGPIDVVAAADFNQFLNIVEQQEAESDSDSDSD